VRTCSPGWTAFAIGHVELVLANNGPLMVLRHTAPLSKKIAKNWNAFRIPTTGAFPCATKRDT
jgi:hypothetical protein